MFQDKINTLLGNSALVGFAGAEEGSPFKQMKYDKFDKELPYATDLMTEEQRNNYIFENDPAFQDLRDEQMREALREEHQRMEYERAVERSEAQKAKQAEQTATQEMQGLGQAKWKQRSKMRTPKNRQGGIR